MEIYIKGKFEHGTGSAAYVVVEGGNEVARGSVNLADGFALEGRLFPCDQFNTEILAAVCGLAKCGDTPLVNVYSNNKCVIKWLSRGEEPTERTPLLDVWRRRSAGKDVFVDYIPFFERDTTGNPWNELCNRLAMEVLQ